MLKYTLILLLITNNIYAKKIKIYLDADRSHHLASASSIEKGIKAAFDEIDNKIQGYDIEFVPKDHKGNVVRSKIHMTEFLNDKEALFILSGIHSPPMIKYRQYINENKILILVPWAAGGPITRHPSESNWIFRLSIYDQKAGVKIIDHAINTMQCKKPHLLLEETPWGESNLKNMSSVLLAVKNYNPNVTWFNWGTKNNQARIILRNIIKSKDDCIIFVGNALEGEVFSKAFYEFDTKIPFISHWGVSAGNYTKNVNNHIRKKIKLSFIQSCFSFVSSPQTDFSKKVFSDLQKKYPEIKVPKDLVAPVGFIHAYDLGRIAIKALEKITITENMVENRENLKVSLENLNEPVQGLIKTYKNPFSVFTIENQEAHEALGIDDFCMAEYGEQDEIIVFPNK